MAYSSAPMENVEQTRQIPLNYSWDSRAATNLQDSKYVNVLQEPIGDPADDFHMLKRDGVETLPLPSTPGTAIVSHYWWLPTTGLLSPMLVVVFASSNVGGVGFVYTYLVSQTTGVITLNTTGTTTSPIAIDTPIYFSEFINATGVVTLYFTGLSIGGLYSISTAGVIANANNTLGFGALVFMDGYLFSNVGGNIYNCALNDPTTWNSSAYISAEAYPDTLTTIARVGPYIVGYGAGSVQYFYDAGIAAPNSPLAANVGSTKRIGYLGGLASFGDYNYFIGAAGNGPPTLYEVQGLQINPIASYPFSKVWMGQGYLNQAIAPYGCMLSLSGHSCYFIRSPALAQSVPPSGVPPTGISYYYDTTTKMWAQLNYRQQSNMLINCANTFVIAQNNQYQTYFSMIGDTNLYRFNPSIYQDNGVNFTSTFITESNDFGNRRLKFGARLLLDSDQTSGVSYCNISWSDDDYATFNTPRQVAMNNEYKQLYALGYFRDRAFRIDYTDNYPMRFRAMEIDYQQGAA